MSRKTKDKKSPNKKSDTERKRIAVSNILGSLKRDCERFIRAVSSAERAYKKLGITPRGDRRKRTKGPAQKSQTEINGLQVWRPRLIDAAAWLEAIGEGQLGHELRTFVRTIDESDELTGETDFQIPELLTWIRRTLKISTLPGNAVRSEFVLTPLQRSILNALNGKALKKQELANVVSGGEDSRLYRAGGLMELKDTGFVEHKENVGYYRPDAPPEDLVAKPKSKS